MCVCVCVACNIFVHCFNFTVDMFDSMRSHIHIQTESHWHAYKYIQPNSNLCCDSECERERVCALCACMYVYELRSVDYTLSYILLLVTF